MTSRRPGAPGAGTVPFEYCLLRAVPRVDRGERINVGVVLYCAGQDVLDCALHLDERRLLSLAPEVDVEVLSAALDAVRAVCHGDPAGGPAATECPRVRFGWLCAPRSSVLQPSPVHAGVTHDARATLARLLERLVL